MNVKSVYFIIYVVEMDRAVSFYRDGFGAEVDYTSPEWSSLTLPGGLIGLHGGRPDTEPAPIGFSVDVIDIDLALSTVKAAGGTVTMAPEPRPDEPIVLARVLDTEGNELTVSADKPDRTDGGHR